MRVPLLIPALLLAAALIAAQSLQFQLSEVLPGAATLLLVYWLACRFSQNEPKCKIRRWAGLGLFFAIALGIGVLRRPPAPPVLENLKEERLLLSGCVVEPSSFEAGRFGFVLQIAEGARVRVSHYSEQSPVPLAYGTQVEFAAQTRLPGSFRNPGGFDYRGYLARRGIYWTATILRNEPIQVLPGSCGSRWQAFISAKRTQLLDRLDNLYPPGTFERGMMRALLLGDSAALQETWKQHFRRTGTYHALIISGTHIGVLAGFLYLLLRTAPGPVWIPILLAGLVGWGYALVTGGSIPAVRAAAGFSLYLLARFFHRRTHILNLLAAVVIAFIVVDPRQLLEASFQLSFLAVAVLGILAQPLQEMVSAPLKQSIRDLDQERWDARLPPPQAAFRLEFRLLADTFGEWVPRWRGAIRTGASMLFGGVLIFWDLFLISALIQISLALPMVLYFHRLSLTGLSANLIATPLLTWAVPVGLLALITGWAWLAWVAALLLRAASAVVEWHSGWEPGLRIPDPPVWLGISFSLALMGAGYALWHRSRWTWGAAGVALALLAVIIWAPIPAEIEAGKLEITAIDVGQGEALFLALPDGTTALMDGGGLPAYGRKRPATIEIGEDVVSPYLWARGIRKLDLIILSHAHEDHGGGVPALIRNFHPRELWTSGLPPSPVSDAIRTEAQRSGVLVRNVQAGFEVSHGEVRFRALAPDAYKTDSAPANEDSLVLLMRYRRHSFLLTGDTSAGILDKASIPAKELPLLLLKSPHHGSRTGISQQFLDRTNPAFALLSVGENNTYHLPSPDVVSQFAKRGITLLRTDRDGAAGLISDGWRVEYRRAPDQPARWFLSDPF